MGKAGSCSVVFSNRRVHNILARRDGQAAGCGSGKYLEVPGGRGTGVELTYPDDELVQRHERSL